jgi:hypothetical protein
MSHHRLRTGALLLLMAFLVLAPAASAADATGVVVIGGIADPSTKMAYVTDPAGTIVAVAISSGKVLWETKEATRPVASAGQHVYAFAPEKGKANVFRVVTLDAGDKGKVIRTSDPITLPDWADVGDALDRFIGPKNFEARSELQGGVLTVRFWHSQQGAGKLHRGEARIDLASGKVTTAPGKLLPRVEPKHSAEVMTVIRKRGWGAIDPIVATDGFVFGRTGGAEGNDWVLTLQVADLKTGELVWKRVIQRIRTGEK